MIYELCNKSKTNIEWLEVGEQYREIADQVIAQVKVNWESNPVIGYDNGRVVHYRDGALDGTGQLIEFALADAGIPEEDQHWYSCIEETFNIPSEMETIVIKNYKGF